jgi:hypothetical protein
MTLDQFITPTLISGATSLGIGLPILIMYLKGTLPTRAQDREKTQRIAEQDAQIAEQTAYTRKLMADTLAQQETIQKVVTTLATLANQLPILVYSVQELVAKERRNEQHGS